MKLTPFVKVDETPFSATQSDVIAKLGEPTRTARNNVELTELDYGEIIFRFQDGGRLEEVTRRAPVMCFGCVAVPFATLEAFVKKHDSSAFERAGFIVSPEFGIAFAPESPNWVTALATHCIPTWDSL